MSKANEHGLHDAELANSKGDVVFGGKNYAHFVPEDSNDATTTIRRDPTLTDGLKVRHEEQTGTYTTDLTHNRAQEYVDIPTTVVTDASVTREGYEHTFGPKTAQKIGEIITRRASERVENQANIQAEQATAQQNQAEIMVGPGAQR